MVVSIKKEVLHDFYLCWNKIQRFTSFYWRFFTVKHGFAAGQQNNILSFSLKLSKTVLNRPKPALNFRKYVVNHHKNIQASFLHSSSPSAYKERYFYWLQSLAIVSYYVSDTTIHRLCSFIDQLLRNTIDCSVLNTCLRWNFKFGLKLSASCAVFFCQWQVVLSFPSTNMICY